MADDKLTDDDIIMRGRAVETLIQMDGWKYLSDWLNKTVELYKESLFQLNNKDIERIQEMRIQGIAYRNIANKPKEWIDEKNKKLVK
jgi:hypothetical protein